MGRVTLVLTCALVVGISHPPARASYLLGEQDTEARQSPEGEPPWQEAAAGYGAVQRAFLREDHETVVGLAETFLAQFPDAAQAARVQIWHAVSLDRLNRSDEALQTLDRLTQRLADDHPLWPEVLFWDGDISQRAAQRARAERVWTRLLGEFSDSAWASPHVALGVGLSALSRGSFDGALVYFRQVRSRVRRGPLAVKARLLEGSCLLQLKQFDEAVAILRPLAGRLSDSKQEVQVAFHLAEAYAGSGRHQKAIRAYRRAIQIHPGSRWSEWSRFGVGWAQFQLGRCEESVATLASVHAHSPTRREPEVLFAWGTCLTRLGEDEQALRRLNRLLTQTPSHPLAFESGLLVADIDRRAGRLGRAAAALEALLAQTGEASSQVPVHLRLGTVRLEQGDTAAARRHFIAALQTAEPARRLAAVTGLADVHLSLGEFRQAQRRYQEVRQLATDKAESAYATYQLGRATLRLGAAEEAATLFRQLIAESRPPLADDARLALALAYVHLQEEDRARNQLAVIRQTQPGGALASRAAYYLALLALGEGREPAVRHLCQEAADGAPRSEEGVEASILLAKLEIGAGRPKLAMERLRTAYRTPHLARRHQGALAKTLGDLARRREAYVEAIEWYARAMELAPSLGGEVLYQLASCYEEGGDIDIAISRYRAIRDREWMVRGQLAAAKLLERQGRWKLAEAVYESLAHEPVPEAKVAREQLALLRDDLILQEAP